MLTLLTLIPFPRGTKKVVILEVREGDEKLRDANGYRKDSQPIVESLKKKGAEAKIVFYSDSQADRLYDELKGVDAILSRVNPGNIPGGEKSYFSFLNRLEANGVQLFSSPTKMLTYGAKDAISKLAGTPVVPQDSYTYYTYGEFVKSFPKTLKTGTRVLKQNRGSQGSGIWKVEVKPGFEGEINGDTPVVCTEANDNHVENFTVEDFMRFCNQYLVGENGMLVDMPYLPRIAEGEVRILLVGESPIFVVHKKPVEGGFSATLGSGATYTYQKPAEWQKLIDCFHQSIPEMKKRLDTGVDSGTPIIWTADFILGPKLTNGEDTYVLGEINCSCVGFTSQLDYGIQDKIATEVLKRIQ